MDLAAVLCVNRGAASVASVGLCTCGGWGGGGGGFLSICLSRDV